MPVFEQLAIARRTVRRVFPIGVLEGKSLLSGPFQCLGAWTSLALWIGVIAQYCLLQHILHLFGCRIREVARHKPRTLPDFHPNLEKFQNLSNSSPKSLSQPVPRSTVSFGTEKCRNLIFRFRKIHLQHDQYFSLVAPLQPFFESIDELAVFKRLCKIVWVLCNCQ